MIFFKEKRKKMRVRGFEPRQEAWEAPVIPLDHTRRMFCDYELFPDWIILVKWKESAERGI
jgi:hypothetical protein